MNFEYWYVFPYAIFVCIFATASGFSGAVLFQPFFYFVLNLPIPASIATGIATETIGMSGGAYQYYRQKQHDFSLIKKLYPFTLLGVMVGFYFFLKISTPGLKIFIGLVMIFIAILQLLSLKIRLTQVKHLNFLAPIITFVSGIFSISTGTGVAEMNQPLIEHGYKRGTRKANATAILLEALADWPITFLNLSLGLIRWDILVFSMAGVLIGSQIGPRIANHLPERLLKVVFSVGIFCIGVFYIWRNF